MKDCGTFIWNCRCTDSSLRNAARLIPTRKGEKGTKRPSTTNEAAVITTQSTRYSRSGAKWEPGAQAWAGMVPIRDPLEINEQIRQLGLNKKKKKIKSRFESLTHTFLNTSVICSTINTDLFVCININLMIHK